MAAEMEASLHGMTCSRRASSALDVVSPAWTKGPKLAPQEMLLLVMRKEEHQPVRKGKKPMCLLRVVVGEGMARRRRGRGCISSSLRTLLLEV